MPGETVLTIRNRHVAPCVEVDPGDRFISAFEGRNGDQVLVTIDRATGAGEVLHGDVDWIPHPVSRDHPYPPIVLSLPERLWLAACWCSALRMTDREAAAFLATA